jgi:hypothetical protein
MQRQTHSTEPPRFFVNSRGILMDRRATGTARRTGYSIATKRATRSEMQLLADMLNEPAAMAQFDAGDAPDWNWAQRIAQTEAAQRYARPVLQEACHGA